MEEIINSGILMDYCLGLISEEEKQKVEQLCKEYPEIDTEIRLLQNGLERYAVKKTTWKKEELKNKIWNEIEKLNTEEENSD